MDANTMVFLSVCVVAIAIVGIFALHIGNRRDARLELGVDVSKQGLSGRLKHAASEARELEKPQVDILKQTPTKNEI